MHLYPSALPTTPGLLSVEGASLANQASQSDILAQLAHTPCDVAAERIVPASSTDSGHCPATAGATLSDVWNCGSFQHALPMRHHGDTSIGVPDVPPASISAEPLQVALGSEADVASHDANPTGPVRDVSAAASAASSMPSAVGLDPVPSEGREEEGSDDDPSMDELSVEHPEWRLPVRVLHYQRAQTYHVLWVAQGESIDEVMTRAEILLTPEGDLFCLQVPAFQPSRDCLTLHWWPTSGIQAFVVADGHRPGDPYQEVIKPGQEVADILRLHMQLAPPSVDTYVASAAPSADTVATPPGLGDLFFHQRAGLPAPSFATAADILADSSLDTRETNLPQVGAPPGIRYLLLGAGGAQCFVDIRPGPSLSRLGLLKMTLCIGFR